MKLAGKRIKRILGFDSPYSWMKWLRMTFAAIALIIALMFGAEFVDFFGDAGIVGGVIFLVVLAVIFAPTLAVLIGISVGAAVLFGGISSGRKQVRSLQESAASGSAEILNLDKIRLKAQLLRFFSRFAAAVAGVSFIVVMLASGLTIDGDAAEYGAFIAILIVSALLAGILRLGHEGLKKQYDKSFKEDIVRKELESFLEDVLFEPGMCIGQDLVAESRLFTGISSFGGNDLLSAKYNNRQFVLSDIHVGQSGERGVVFRGRFMVFDYRAISGEPVWVHDKRMKAGSGAIQTALDSFNKTFGITAKDAIAALRILTPPVIEGIALASKRIKHPMSLAFLNDKIYIAIESGESFEGATEGDATFSEQLGKVKRDVQAICDMVETLYLR
ncbi:MAG: DUF3137 domain-containing protein [Oscillospiraceae bacterium]|nr:DUF3137 domain-containing protein [Oscillospiraceae bacterium]